MNLSINNVRGVIPSVSLNNETSSQKLQAVDTFEMVRGGSWKGRKDSATGKDGAKESSVSDAKADAGQSQVQNSKEAGAKEEAATQTQAQGQGQTQADAKSK